jgi:hypothetical protein
MATTTPRQPTAPLNLAALVAPLPPVILPNGTSHQMMFTAQAAELYKQIRHHVAAHLRGEAIDDLEAEAAIDACLAHVLPSATPDDLASLGVRVEWKVTILAAASGRVDEVLHALAAATAGNASGGEATPDSPPVTTSASS